MENALTDGVLEPDLPILDPHHHLWDRQIAAKPVTHDFERISRDHGRYLLDEFVRDLNGGHNIAATVFVECHSMYRAEGTAALRPIGETEFVNGIAAMSASGQYGRTRIAAAIVGKADLTLGDAAAETMDGHLAASTRFRGIRHSASWDRDPAVLGPLAIQPEGLYASDPFREGFRHLAPRGLTFDAWLLEPQLPDLIDLARAFPDQPIVLDHIATPLGLASYAGRRPERFSIWRDNLRRLAESPNVVVKLGGLAMPFCGFTPDEAQRQSYLWWAEQWRPYIDTAIETFTPSRCMFESNFPVDKFGCSYTVLWNAFKHLAAAYTPDEKAALFAGTAARFYSVAL